MLVTVGLLILLFIGSRLFDEHVGWLDRGVVAAGYLADLNVIDFGALGCLPPQIVNDPPAA